MTATARLPVFDKITLPYPGSLDIEVGDLCFLNPASPFSLGSLTANSLYPAASMPDQGSVADNQRLFAALFAGVSKERHLATDTIPTAGTAPTNEATHDVVPTWVGDVSCTASAFNVGSLLGVAENGGNNGVLSQQVALVTDPDLAIGYAIQDTAGVSVTTIRCVLFGNAAPYGTPDVGLGKLRETAGYASITGASTTGTYTFTGKIPKGSVVLGYRAYVATALAGPSLSAATLELGVSGTLGAFSGNTTENVFAAGPIGSMASNTYGSLAADTVPVATFALTGCNANALTAGSIVFEVIYLPPMAR